MANDDYEARRERLEAKARKWVPILSQVLGALAKNPRAIIEYFFGLNNAAEFRHHNFAHFAQQLLQTSGLREVDVYELGFESGEQAELERNPAAAKKSAGASKAKRKGKSAPRAKAAPRSGLVKLKKKADAKKVAKRAPPAEGAPDRILKVLSSAGVGRTKGEIMSTAGLTRTQATSGVNRLIREGRIRGHAVGHVTKYFAQIIKPTATGSAPREEAAREKKTATEATANPGATLAKLIAMMRKYEVTSFGFSEAANLLRVQSLIDFRADVDALVKAGRLATKNGHDYTVVVSNGEEPAAAKNRKRKQTDLEEYIADKAAPAPAEEIPEPRVRRRDANGAGRSVIGALNDEGPAAA